MHVTFDYFDSGITRVVLRDADNRIIAVACGKTKGEAYMRAISHYLWLRGTAA